MQYLELFFHYGKKFRLLPSSLRLPPRPSRSTDFGDALETNGPERRRLCFEQQLTEGNGYETLQSSLLYVFVLFFGLDGA